MTPDLVIRGAVLLRPPFDERASQGDVVIGGGRIVAITETDPPGWPDGIPVLDGRSGFVMPGLIDAHAHLTSVASRAEPWLDAYLEAGVTSVREAGARDDAAFDLARGRAGRPPRILTAGWMLKPTTGPDDRPITETAQEAVRRGASWLKAYELPPEEVADVAAVAVRNGLPVAAHLGSAARASVRAADLTAIEHVFSLLEYDLVDPETRRRAGIPSTDEPIATYLLADPTHGVLRAWIEELGARGVTVTPTLTVMAALVGRTRTTLDVISHEEAPWATSDELAAWRERLVAFGWWIAPARASRVRRRRVLARFAEIVVALHEAGCPIAAGTDLGEPFIEPGRGLIREMRALHDAGLSRATVLAAATSVPARLLGQSDDLGDVVVGGRADLLLLDADPRLSLSALDRIRAVVAGGCVVANGRPAVRPAIRCDPAEPGVRHRPG